MSKLGIAIAVAGASLAVATICALKSRAINDAYTTKKLKELRDDLELDCELIESAADEIPQEIVTAADRKFAEAVTEAVDFATTIFSVHMHLDDDEIDNLTLEAKRAYMECISAIIKNAERYIYAIDAAREEMLQVRKAFEQAFEH